MESSGSQYGRARRRGMMILAGGLPLLLAGCLFNRDGIVVDAGEVDFPGPDAGAGGGADPEAPARDARPAATVDAAPTVPPPGPDAASGGGTDRPGDLLAVDRPAALPPDAPVDLPPDRPADRPFDTAPAVILRINVNGPAHAGQDLPGAWAADPGPGGVCGPNVYANPMPIAGTRDDSLFQTEMFGNPLVCAVGRGGLPPGRYQVNLYFAEIFWGPGCPGGGGAGSRVFDVRVEGALVEGSVDLFREGGCAASAMPGGRPIVKRYTTTINDGTLDLRFDADVDNGKISAIELLSAF